MNVEFSYLKQNILVQRVTTRGARTCGDLADTVMLREDETEAVAHVDDADDELFRVAEGRHQRDTQRRQSTFLFQDRLVGRVQGL